MDSINKLVTKLSIETDYLTLEMIQETILKSKQYFKCPHKNIESWNQISKVLWSHLQKGLKNLDNQLLCATCFFSIIPLTDMQSNYMTELLQVIDEELLARAADNNSTKTFQVISMVYGIFQSSFFTQGINENVSDIVPILKSAVNLLLIMCYEYSQYTFLAFKTIKSFKKVQGTCLQHFIFNEQNLLKLLNLTNHNWENPVTGVRDLNRSIFQIVISTVHGVMYEIILKEINGFYWNKAKYLMLSEVIESKRGGMLEEVYKTKWIDGLINSLYKPGLVSAGADMYYAFLKRINTEEEWCELFLTNIMSILNGTNTKAIENFNNYWCLTTLKKYPMLSKILIMELDKYDDSEQKVYSSLCIMKQGNKLGIINKSWNLPDDYKLIERTVLCGIENSNNYTRMQAFDILCVPQGKSVPTAMEYQLILKFLINNVNSDCTVLRLSMLNSFINFLNQLHLLFLNNIVKNCNKKDIANLTDFSKNLQEFIVDSINHNGNYQRKITSVKLCDAMLTCLSKVPRKKKAQTRQANVTLLDFLKEKQYWILSQDHVIAKLVSLLKDPADDIRENTTKLLLNHYSVKLRESTLINSLFNDALACMRSKFFFEISCGQTMFKLIAYLLVKEKHVEIEFKSADDIFFFTYNQLISEYKLNRDIMKSIEIGKQLHSFMNILLVVLEVCYSNSYKLGLTGIMAEFLGALEVISNQFSWEQDTTSSSDFSKMSDMVQNIITMSGYNPSNEGDESKISGMQQIVLNSIWLNVKASCDLAYVLIKYNTDDTSMCEKCLIIITHVLESSRHKGAIEAAGAALGRAIQYLTSLPEKNKGSELPYALLKCKLNNLISETNKMSSITRRGAGLSIMVHRIVASDMKKEKPLFHYFMNTLLDVFNNTEDIPNEPVNDVDMENQIDLPKAIYIHFLTRIVTDSSLASDLMYYSAKLAVLAFGHLTSPHWQIRNASLQLYGAFIPRQIGQKKASGTDEETIATVAYDEFRTHSPKLWDYIIGQLHNQDVVDKIQYHSNLVPILNLFASVAMRYNFSYDSKVQRSADDILLKCLVALLGSPIHTVRRLTAKSIFNIYEFDIIYTVLSNVENVSENFLHGSVMLLRFCHKYCLKSDTYEQHFNNLKYKFGLILSNGQHSYFCREIFEDTCINEFNVKDVEEALLEIKNNMHIPGVSLWAETRLRKFIHNCSWREIQKVLKCILQQNEYEKYCYLILSKFELNSDVPKECLLDIVDILLLFEKKYCSSIIWKILYAISQKIDLCGYLDITTHLRKLEGIRSIYILRFLIPLLARNIENAPDDEKLALVEIIDDLSNFEKSDVEMRYIAAIANNELANQFDDLSDTIKVVSLKVAVILVQDEDDHVRDLSVNFYKIVCKQKVNIHPFICLHNILDRKFLLLVFSDAQSIQTLCKMLSAVLYTNHIVDEYNPFANDSKNIYLEPELLRGLIHNLKNG